MCQFDRNADCVRMDCDVNFTFSARKHRLSMDYGPKSTRCSENYCRIALRWGGLRIVRLHMLLHATFTNGAVSGADTCRGLTFHSHWHQVKALSEELENPDNTHRWRRLDGSDPGTYEMVHKIQALQKRLIFKTEVHGSCISTKHASYTNVVWPNSSRLSSILQLLPFSHAECVRRYIFVKQEVVEKDLLIQEKDKLYVELKNILARQPGPEVAEQLSIYQQGLRDKTKAMKAMASELNMYQAQVRIPCKPTFHLNLI